MNDEYGTNVNASVTVGEFSKYIEMVNHQHNSAAVALSAAATMRDVTSYQRSAANAYSRVVNARDQRANWSVIARQVNVYNSSNINLIMDRQQREVDDEQVS